MGQEWKPAKIARGFPGPKVRTVEWRAKVSQGRKPARIARGFLSPKLRTGLQGAKVSGVKAGKPRACVC